MSNLTLQKFEAHSFLGIDKEKPVILDFTKAKNKKFIKLTGDQETGKSSTLMAIMYAMGAAFEIDKKNFPNAKDGTIAIDLEFEYEGIAHHVIGSGNSLKLKKMYGDKWIDAGEPKTTLRKIFGNLGTSPMFLKTMRGKDQIQWFKDTFGNDLEVTKKEQKYIDNLKLIEKDRRDANREIKSIKGFLNESPLFLAYEKSQKKFAEPVVAKKEKDRLEALTAKKTQYDNAVNTLTSLKLTRTAQENTIAELERKLLEEKEKLVNVENRIADGEAWTKANSDIVSTFDKANEDWLNISKILIEQDKWKEILKKEKDLHEYEEVSKQADSRVDKLRMELLKLTKTYLPEIEGLEIRVKVGLDDEDEGVYYMDKTLAQLSESELTELFAEIYFKKNSQFIFLENVTSFGSTAVALFNRLIKDGVQIFASEMDRSQKEMQINFLAKVN